MEGKYQDCLEIARKSKSDIVLLLGQTGGGKSTVANSILGKKGLFQEGKGLTSVCQVEEGKWFGTKEDVTVIDTPGFLDSENRDAVFLANIVEFLRGFPKDKLRVVIVTLPLMETRAKNTYKDMIDTIELMLGEKAWDNTVFVTTLRNQLSAEGDADFKVSEWKRWLRDTVRLQKFEHCDFVYSNPEDSLDPVFKLFLKLLPFTPATSNKIDLYLQSNPSASVGEIIENVETINKLREKFEKDLQKLKSENDESIKRLEQNHQQLTTRLKGELDNMKTQTRKYEEKIKQLESNPRVIHHHHSSGGGGRSGCVLY